MPGSVAGAVGGIAQGVIGSNAAGAAAKAGEAAAQQSNQVATNVYNTNTSNLNPYIQTGTNAQNALGGLLGLNGDTAAQGQFQNYLNSTNYNFQLGQGLQGVQYGNAPALNSGATSKALNNYAQGMAGSALSGYESMLGGLGGQGESAASTLGTLGNQYAGQYASNTFGGANAQQQGILGQAAALQNGIQNFTQGSSFSNPYTGSSYQQPSTATNLWNGVSSMFSQPSSAASGASDLEGLY